MHMIWHQYISAAVEVTPLSVMFECPEKRSADWLVAKPTASHARNQSDKVNTAGKAQL